MKKISFFGRTIKVLDTKRHYKDEVAAVLDRAADLFDEVGWTKGTECDDTGRLCAIGAIALASGTPISVMGKSDANGAWVEFEYADEDPATEILRRKAIAAATLETAPRMNHIVFYNDRKSSRKGDVQAKLRAAAQSVRSGATVVKVERPVRGVDAEVVATKGKRIAREELTNA